MTSQRWPSASVIAASSKLSETTLPNTCATPSISPQNPASTISLVSTPICPLTPAKTFLTVPPSSMVRRLVPRFRLAAIFSASRIRAASAPASR